MKKKRPPIIAVMGHVNHGKTSLIDILRKSNITQTEKGKITQHINAYEIMNQKIPYMTLIDTPGHQAFKNIRDRTFKIADIILLIISAEEGIKKQTIEIIKYINIKKVPIIIAINKIDKINNNKIENHLIKYGIISDNMGGDIKIIKISVTKNIGLDKLRKNILTLSKFLNLTAEYNKKASGVIIESRISKYLGIIATLIIKEGTLKIGDTIIIKNNLSKIRVIIDDNKKNISNATPSKPVIISGLKILPEPGDNFFCIPKKEKIKKNNFKKINIKKNNNTHNVNSKKKILKLIIKADTKSSIEAIIYIIKNIKNEYIEILIKNSGIGDILYADINLSKITKSIILGFNIKVHKNLLKLSKLLKINIYISNIIYELEKFLINEVKNKEKGRIKYEILGNATVKEIINIEKFGNIAGCVINKGIIKKNYKINIVRDKDIIYNGDILNIKRYKKEVKEVKEGLECGILCKDFNRFEIGDKIESYKKII